MSHPNPFEIVRTWMREYEVELTDQQRLALQEEIVQYGGRCIDLYKKGLIQRLGEWFSVVMGT